MPLQLSRLTREYVKSEITTSNDLSLATCEFAFVAPGQIPVELDWGLGDLLQDLLQVDTWVARILVGDGSGVPLTPPGAEPIYPYDWQVWLRIDDNPERPVRRPGIITME